MPALLNDTLSQAFLARLSIFGFSARTTAVKPLGPLALVYFVIRYTLIQGREGIYIFGSSGFCAGVIPPLVPPLYSPLSLGGDEGGLGEL